MPQEQIPGLIAFLAGLVSFVSPCVLPLIPAYITNLSGVALYRENPSLWQRLVVLLHAGLFVLGFSGVFILFWASVGLVGYVAQGFLPYIRMAGGTVLVFLGLHTMGLWRLPFLYRQWSPELPGGNSPGYPRSFFIGVIFASGHTPCIGPVLAGILGLAALRDSVWQGTYLLGAYSTGLALPFLATALAMNPVLGVLRRTQRYQRAISILSGLFLIGVGFLLLTNMFIRIPRYFYWGAL